MLPVSILTITLFSFVVATLGQHQADDEVFDVVIVGAGLTGLSAARELKKKAPEARVKVLEARDEVGGRIRSKVMRTAEGETLVDVGPNFISPSAAELVALTKELQIPLYTQSNCGMRTLNIRGFRTKRQSSLLTTLHTFKEVLESPNLVELAAKDVHSYFANNKSSRAEIDTANRLLQILYDSPDISASIIHLMLASGSENATLADMLSRYGHGQSSLMQGGLNRMTRALAEKVDIAFNETVTSIEEGETQAIVHTNSGTYRAHQVIVTVPPVLTSSIEFTPPLEAQFTEFTKKYAPTGRAYYFTMTFTSPFWRPRGKNGQIIYTNAQGPVVWLTTFDVGRLTSCAGTGTTGVLWGIAHFSDNGPTSQAQRNAAYTDVINKSLGLGTHLPLDVSDVHFASDAFARGTVGVIQPGVNFTSLHKYIQGVNTHGKRIVFASAEYSNKSMGLMNGALVSGQIAATLVESRLPNLEGSGEVSLETTNELPTIARLNDDASERTVVNLLAVDPTTSAFEYRTSSQYPPTTSTETSTFTHFSFGNTISEDNSSEPGTKEELGNTLDTNAEVESPAPNSSFLYQTSTQYPPSSTIDTSTITHFSFGNAEPPKPFIPPKIVPNPSITTIPPPTTTERSTFTPVDPSRSTTPFTYRTSMFYSPLQPPETTTFKHFSYGVQEETELGITAQHDALAQNTVDAEVVKSLKDAVDEAPTLNPITLAKKLSSILYSLLQTIQRR